MIIEVEWKARPSTGVTEIELSDLGVKTKKEWRSLSNLEQENRLNKYLLESESYICAKAIDW